MHQYSQANDPLINVISGWVRGLLFDHIEATGAVMTIFLGMLGNDVDKAGIVEMTSWVGGGR